MADGYGLVGATICLASENRGWAMRNSLPPDPHPGPLRDTMKKASLRRDSAPVRGYWAEAPLNGAFQSFSLYAGRTLDKQKWLHIFNKALQLNVIML